MHNDELQTRLEDAVEASRAEKKSNDVTIGQGILADRILRLTDVNGAYSLLSKALLHITGKTRLRDCSVSELEAVEITLTNVVSWHDHRICTECPFAR